MAGTTPSNTSGYDRHRGPYQGPEETDINAEQFQEMLKATREILGELEPTGNTPIASSSGLPSGFREGELESGKAATVAVELPEFVNARGRIDGGRLRAFLLAPENREHTDFWPSRKINYLSEAAIFPTVVWATGRQPQSGQSIEDYYTVNTNSERNLLTFTTAAGDDFAGPFFVALRHLHVSGTKDHKVPIGLNSKNEQIFVTVAEVVRLDPVNSCRFLLQQQSPNDGFGTDTVGAALSEFRKIMNLL